MKTGKFLFTALLAFICVCVLTVSAAATAVYLSASGNDANDGLTPDTAVATFAAAQTLAQNNASVDTVYIMGTVATTGNQNVGVAGKTMSYLGYGESPALTFTGRETLVGDVIFDGFNLKPASNYASIFTKQFDFTLGSGMTGTGFGSRSINAAYQTKVYADDNTPTVITLNNPYNSVADNVFKEVGPCTTSSSTGGEFYGYLVYDIGSTTRISNFYGPLGDKAATMSMNGAVEVHAAYGSYIVTLNMTGYNTSATGTLVSRGLRDFHLDGKVDKLYLAGSATRAASADSTGVAVWTFSSTSTIGSSGGVVNFRENGIANETNVTHVLIFNNNSKYHTDYTTNSATWTVPNEYVFNVDNKGTAEAVTSTWPTADNDYACVFGGVDLFSASYTFAVIDEGTANEQYVYLSGMTDGKHTGRCTVDRLTNGDHTVTFTNTAPAAFTATAASKAGYVAASAGAAETSYAILASVQLADWVKPEDVASIGFYGYTADSNTAKVTLSNAATIATLTEDGNDRKFYAVIDEIPTAATSVVLKPFVVLTGSVTCAGDAASYVPETIGATTYYGSQAELDDFFG